MAGRSPFLRRLGSRAFKTFHEMKRERAAAGPGPLFKTLSAVVKEEARSDALWGSVLASLLRRDVQP